MDKRDIRETIQNIKDSYAAGDYARTVACADTLNLKKVKEPKVLEIISDAYEKCGANDKAFMVSSSLYTKYGASRQSAFKLCELSVKNDDLDKAVEYYNDFCRIAPHDNAKFLLKYEIGKAGGIERKELIKVLESYVSREKDEKWEYELARMYHEAGLENNCVKLCDDIFTWFAEGEYVKKALELKFAHKALSPEQQKKYEKMMERRIILDNPGRYVVEEPEEEKTSSHIETFEASEEDDEDVADTRIMSAEAVNREIDRMEEAPKITRFEAAQDSGDEEPIDEEMTISLSAAIAANTRETQKAAILEAVLKAQELAAGGQQENTLFFAMEDNPQEEETPPAPKQRVSVKLSPEQAAKLGAQEIAVSPLASQVSRPELKTGAPAAAEIKEAKEPPAPEPEEIPGDEIWLDSELIPEEDTQEEKSVLPPEEPDDVWEEAPGPGPKLTKSADISNIPMESSADGQIGIDLDMLTDDSEGIEGQMTIDEVFAQYAQKVKENEAKYAEIEAERLRQIQESVSGMVPTPLYEIEDEPEPDSPTKDVTMNVTELFSSGASIEKMIQAAEDAEAKPTPEQYNDDDLSVVREVNIADEIADGTAVAESVAEDEAALLSSIGVALAAQFSSEDDVKAELKPAEPETNGKAPEVSEVPEAEEAPEVPAKPEAKGEAAAPAEAETEEVQKSSEEPESGFDALLEAFDKEGVESTGDTVAFESGRIEAELAAQFAAEIEEEAQAGEQPEKDELEDDFDAILAALDSAKEEGKEAEDKDNDFESMLAAFDSADEEESEEAQEDGDFESMLEAFDGAEEESPEKEETKPQNDGFDSALAAFDGGEESGQASAGNSEDTFRINDIDTIMATLLGETLAIDSKEIQEALAKSEEEEPEIAPEPEKPEKPAKPAREGSFKLSDDLKKDLEEFMFIDGMEDQICDTVENIVAKKRAGDASGGNLIITGDSKTGKTYLAVNIIKAVTGETGGGVEKVAKVQAQALNGKNIDKVFEKIGSSDLIIENVGFLGDETIQGIIASMRAKKPGGMVVLEGNQLAVENIFYTFPEARTLFDSRVDINELNIVQWSEIACKYAKTRGYIIDDMGLLALHAKINEINLPTERLGYRDVIKVVDKAIQNADRRNVGKLFSAFSHKHGDGMKEIIEADFE